MNNKFNIGEEVMYSEYKATVGNVEHRTNGYIYRLDNELGSVFNVEEKLLQPYIEEDTKAEEVIVKSDIKLFDVEEDTQEEMLKFHNDGSLSNIMGSGEYDSIGKQAPVGLDYEKEYNNLLEEHAETKELLEIAKVALKLTTELISTND
jgi:hypothetical protein